MLRSAMFVYVYQCMISCFITMLSSRQNSLKMTLFCYIKCLHVRRKSYSSMDYCLNVVKSLDRENYFCTLLLPQHVRTAGFAIRAFNAEIASVQDQVSQANLGLMRMKFWEDAIDKIYNGKVPNNPVAVELAKAIKRHKLSKSHLQRLISSRAKRLGQTSFLTSREMEDYAEESCASIYLLLLQAAGIKSVTCDHAASHAGKAQGLVNLLRGIPYCLSRRSLALPSDLLAQHNVSEESVFRGTFGKGLFDVVFDVAGNAHIHLEKFRDYLEDIPIEARRIFLPIIPTQRYLVKLRSSHFDVLDSELQRKSPFLPIILYWHALMKTL